MKTKKIKLKKEKESNEKKIYRKDKLDHILLGIKKKRKFKLPEEKKLPVNFDTKHVNKKKNKSCFSDLSL